MTDFAKKRNANPFRNIKSREEVNPRGIMNDYSRLRWILPETVLGRASLNTTILGYL